MNKLKIGDKVKLNIEVIQNQANYPKNCLPNYVAWINENHRTEFILTRVVCGIWELSHQNEEVIWTFWEGHLIKI